MSEPKTLLAKVYQAFKPAVPVWVVLSALAARKKRSLFFVKRTTLAWMSGVKRLTAISTALTTLERYGILARKVRCRRRRDGTVFRRLRIRLLHRVSKSATLLESAKALLHSCGTGERKSATLPGSGKALRNRVEERKSATLLREWRHVPHAATARDSAPSAVATVAPSRAEHHVMIKLPEHWESISSALAALLKSICAQVGCYPEEFRQLSSKHLELRDDTGRSKVRLELIEDGGSMSAIFHCRDADLEPMTEPWTGSRDQVMLLRHLLERKRAPGSSGGS